jgi:hypothetical protein
MKVTAETEMMKNQKHADVMRPDIAFDVIQAADGGALFFSIGTDHVLYATRQLPSTKTGWTKIDLSSSLSSMHHGASVVAKTFALSQNPQTLGFDLVVVITVAGTDWLYASTNHTNDVEGWEKPISWVPVPFDSVKTTAPTPLLIADVYLMNMASADDTSFTRNCFVDIVRDPKNPFQLLDRYVIQLESTPKWVRHTLAIDLKAGTIFSCLGRRTDDFGPGIYTFGSVDDTQELIYTPQINFFDPDIAPSPARLTLPAGATSIASSLNGQGETALFVAARGGIYVFTPNNQSDQARPILVVPSSSFGSKHILAGVSSFATFSTSNRTVIVGVNSQGVLFHVSCTQGQEDKPASWSTPMPLSSGVEKFAFYLNNKASNNVIFAHTSGQNMLQLVQDPITNTWTTHNILLPATNVNDVVEFNSFTTHIQVTDDNTIPLPNSSASFTSQIPLTVYINDVYYVLTPDVPITATCGVSGAFTVIQQTQSFNAVPFQVTLSGKPPIVVQVDPMSRAIQRLNAIQSGDDLSKVQVTTADGTKKPLVPASVSSNDKDSAAKAIKQLLIIKGTLPADGSVRGSKSVNSINARSLTAAPTTWGVVRGENGLVFHEGTDAAMHLGLPRVHTQAVSRFSLGGAISTGFGDLFNALKDVSNEIGGWVVQESEGLQHFFVQLADKVYHAVLDCASAVVSAVEFVFNQIKVFIEEIIAWLGFLFNWKDILRTHSVMKNIIKQYSVHAVDQLASVETSLDTLFTDLEAGLNSWAGMTDQSINRAPAITAAGLIPGRDDPQSNWAYHHTENGMDSADSSHTDGVLGNFETALHDLAAVVTDEIGIIEDMVDQVKAGIVDKISSLSIVDVVKKIIAVIGDFVVKSAKNILIKTVDLLRVVSSAIIDILDASIDIPIISWIYKLITGSDRAMLDLVCLVCAIPATLTYKLVKNAPPFPDDDHTTALMKASDFASLSKLLRGSTATSAKSIIHETSVTPDSKGATTRLAMTSPMRDEDSADDHFSSRDIALNESALAPATLDLAVDIDPDRVNVANIVLDITAGFSSILVALAMSAKNKVNLPAIASSKWRGLSFAAYLVYVGPDISGAFASSGSNATIANDVITGVSVLKTGVDNLEGPSRNATWQKVSPYLECLINLSWFYPPIQAFIDSDKKKSDQSALAANLLFDCGGALTPFQNRPEVFAAMIMYTLTYGYAIAQSGVMVAAGD